MKMPRFTRAAVFLARMEEAERSLVEWLAHGMPVTPRPKFDARRAACAACPHHLSGPPFDRCGLCGCLTALKPWLATEHCPDRRWPAATPASETK
jgi:hypothetical protein